MNMQYKLAQVSADTDDVSLSLSLLNESNKVFRLPRLLRDGELAAQPRSRPSAQSASWEFTDVTAV